MTSGPIPSPGTAAILCLRMRFLSCLGSERAQDALGPAFEVGRAGDVARPCRWACQRPIHRPPHRGGRLDGRESTLGAAESSADRLSGTECVTTCASRVAPYHYKSLQHTQHDK